MAAGGMKWFAQGLHDLIHKIHGGADHDHLQQRCHGRHGVPGGAVVMGQIADLMAAIEKNGAETVRAMAAALVGLRVEAPPVNMTVQPAEVLVQMPERAGWRFKVKYLPNGALDEIDALPRLAP